MNNNHEGKNQSEFEYMNGVEDDNNINNVNGLPTNEFNQTEQEDLPVAEEEKENQEELHNENIATERMKKASRRRGFHFKGVLSTLAAGIIGSVLTLTVLPHTDYFNELYSGTTKVENAVSNETSSSNNSNDLVSVQKTSTSSSSSIADTVEKASKAIVGVVNIQEQQMNFNGNSEDVENGTGSGVIFKKQNGKAYIVTNNHVIEGAQKIEVSLYNGEKTTATLIGADALTDLAVLEINDKNVSTVLEFGDSSVLRPGDQVLAIGNPLGLDFSRSVTQGIVSATDRSITVTTSAGDWDLNVIQTDAAINPGNSGGALINTAGQVMGINSLKISESGVEGLGFAIPSNDLVPIINEIIEKGKVERPYLGVSLASLDEVPQAYLQNLDQDINEGAIITQVDPNSAAAKAGLNVEDIIISINGNKIENTSDLRKFLYSEIKIGDKIKLEVYQDGKLKTVEVKLTSNNL